MKKYFLLVLATCLTLLLSMPLSASWTNYIYNSSKTVHLVDYKKFLIKNKKIVLGGLGITGIAISSWLMYKKYFSKSQIELYETKLTTLDQFKNPLITSSLRKRIVQSVSQWVADQTTSFPSGVIQSTIEIVHNETIYQLRAIYNKQINPSWTFVELRIKDQKRFLQFAVPAKKSWLF